MRIPDLVPDILVYAKSFGGGKSSISGYSYTNEVAKSYDSLRDATLHSSTYYGFGEEVVTALTAINILIDEKLVENSEKIGLFAKPRFDQIAKKSNLITEVRGSGSLWGFILDSNVFEVAVKVLRKLNIMEDIFADERIAKKILCGAIVNHLYENHGVLTYFGVNIDNPLIVSFPLIATEEEVCIVADALEKTFSVSLSFLLTSFIKSKVRGPKTHVK
jgi:putrescine aminotransferase